MSFDTTYAGRRAVVVGGTHGIGLAIAQRLVDGAAEVLVTGRDAAKVAEAAAALGPAATGLAGDVTSEDHRSALAERAGEVDAVFVNVGIAEVEPFAEVSEASGTASST
nr:SDR family NAD(P)-dependent oxidoreductase [Conexibacter sp. SYSU D00693]